MKKKYFLLSALIAAFTGSFAQTTTSFSYSGAMQTFTVPTCVYSIHVDMSGAQGGGNASVNAAGGKGGRVQADIPVTPGQTLNIFVGGTGDPTGIPGYNGGGSGFGGSVSNPGSGGGGASDIRIGGTTLNDRVVVAGGGGGGTENGGPAPGGAGGGLAGDSGQISNPWACANFTKATGGTQSTGGLAGTSTGCAWNGSNGTFGVGGDSYQNYRCSGGGGGWYGGGGGHNGGGGGGGSSYTSPSAANVIHTQGYQTGNGIVTLTYAPGPPMPGAISGSSALCENTTATYSISPIVGATSYTWTIPAGTIINSGQGTVSINVTAGTTSGNITVYATDACGNSPVQTLSITVDPASVAGTASANMTGVCVGDPSTSFSVTGETGNVAWEMSNDGGMTWQNFGSGNPFMPGTPNVSDTGTILVHAVVTSGACSPATSNNISFVIYPPSNAGTPSVSADTICEGSSVTLSSAGTSSGTLMWYSYNGSTYTYLGNGNGYTVTNLSVGDHWYVAMLTSGTCTADTSAAVFVHADTASFAGSPTTTAIGGNLCVNDSVLFMTSGNTGSIQWLVFDTGSGQWVNFGSGNPFDPGAPDTSDVGMYTFVAVATTNGVCPSDTSSSFVVNVRPLPVVDLGADTTVCGGIMFDAGNSGSSYTWSTSETTQTINDSITGNYSVMVTTAYGCSSSDTVMVTVNPNPTSTGSATSNSVCLSDAAVMIIGFPGGGIWSGNGVTGNFFDPSAAGLGSSTVTYTYTDTNGCSNSTPIIITVNACTGVVENSLAGALNVFPNPSNGMFTLLVNEDANELLIEMIDVSGKTVYSSAEKDVHAGFRKEITTESISGGIYLLRVTSENEQAIMKVSVQK